jgi:hypothetical protein
MLFNVAMIETLASSKKTIIGSCWIGWVMHAGDMTSLFMPVY